MNILLVDDDPIVVQTLGHTLAEQGRVCFVTQGRDVLRVAREQQADLILLDLDLPDMNGFEVLRALRADAALREVPVIFLTGHASQDEELLGLSLGAVDFIHKPPSAPLVQARVQTHLRLKQATDLLRQAADTDGLTGIANRRHFDQALAREAGRARRNGESLALLLVDIDHFKRYNDHFGHPLGDQCLREVARAMADALLRPADLLARYGGEEFVALLPQMDMQGAQVVAQAMLKAVKALALPHPAQPHGGVVSISVGVAAGETDATVLLATADAAVYAAKRAGRNQVCLGVPNLGTG